MRILMEVAGHGGLEARLVGGVDTSGTSQATMSTDTQSRLPVLTNTVLTSCSQSISSDALWDGKSGVVAIARSTSSFH